MSRRDEHGQVLIIVALALVVLLGASAFTIDLGRRAAEERFLQNAADAAALAGCNAMIDGATHDAALQEAREIATINLASSPAGSDASIAAAGSEEYLDGHHGNPYQMTSGAVIANDSVYVAIDSEIDTTVGRVLGRDSLGAYGRARCHLEPEPALPFVARRYQDPPGPGDSFVDHLATAATSGSGAVDASDPRGYDGRTPASELAPGPEFLIFGPDSRSTNTPPSFRGFIALDVRDFTHDTSRKYYNGATDTMSANTLKNHHAAYITDGYPGPAFPAVENPPTGATQVGIMVGTTNAQTTQPFNDAYAEGDRVMLSLYNGTVMTIPDFSIQPPVEIALPATTTVPVDGPTFEVSRNNAFSSSVSFRLVGDDGATVPEHDILPDPSVTPPATGQMDEPTFSPDGFVPATGGTDVGMLDISTNEIPEGVYTVWLEGYAGSPDFQERRQPVPVRIGTVTRDFSLDGSILDGAIESLGGTVTLPLNVATGTGTSAWDDGSSTATGVNLSWDSAALTDCSHNSVVGVPIVTFDGSSSLSVTPASGSGTNVSLAINAGSLASGCYLFPLRAQGTNADGQPVVRLEYVQFTVAATAGPSEYVDIIGFAVFEITDIGANTIRGQAITGIHADPNALELRAAQRPRLIPWNP